MNPVIKICGMRESENIMAAAALKPDILGFIFYPESPRYAGEMLDPEVLSKLPGNIMKAGVFVNSDFSNITWIAEKYSLDIVQLHGEESPELCHRLKDTGLQVIKVFNIEGNIGLSRHPEYTDSTDYFLFDTKGRNYGGSGLKFDWRIFDNHDPGHLFFLSGGIGPDDINNVRGMTSPFFCGIDLNSRFEVKPGLKDIEKLEKFINELRDKHKIS